MLGKIYFRFVGDVRLNGDDKMKKHNMEKCKNTKNPKGLATRFLAMLLLIIVVILIIVFIFYKYSPGLFQTLFDLITKPMTGGG